MQGRRDWAEVIRRLNESPTGRLTIRMGSAGSAQVTRCRLLRQWSNLDARTRGRTLYLSLRP